jgi:hypothetical protein
MRSLFPPRGPHRLGRGPRGVGVVVERGVKDGPGVGAGRDHAVAGEPGAVAHSHHQLPSVLRQREVRPRDRALQVLPRVEGRRVPPLRGKDKVSGVALQFHYGR